VLIGDAYEETGRQNLKNSAKKISNPSPATLAKELAVMYKADLEEICNICV